MAKPRVDTKSADYQAAEDSFSEAVKQAENGTTAITQANFDGLDFNFDDLKDLDRVQVDVDGYWNPEKSPIFGTLLGVAKAIETSKGVTGIYAIQLAKPCAGRKEGSQESEECILQPGQVVGVFHSFGLNPLKSMGGAKVAIRRKKEQRELNNGNSMWDYDIRASKERRKLDIIDNRSPENSDAPF